jgi:hypothetical protein
VCGTVKNPIIREEGREGELNGRRLGSSCSAKMVTFFFSAPLSFPFTLPYFLPFIQVFILLAIGVAVGVGWGGPFVSCPGVFRVCTRHPPSF